MIFRLTSTWMSYADEWSPERYYPDFFKEFGDRITITENNQYAIKIINLQELMKVLTLTCGRLVIESADDEKYHNIPLIEIYDTWREC